ncbi:MAG: flotillin-like FloA family protein [Planctomycetaceae bacterium]
MFASVASLWFRAFMSSAGVGPLQMVVMKLKKVNPTVIVDSRIMAVQAGLEKITTNAMESHYRRRQRSDRGAITGGCASSQHCSGLGYRSRD